MSTESAASAASTPSTSNLPLGALAGLGAAIVGAVWFAAEQTGLPFFMVLTSDFGALIDFMSANFAAMDLLFYALAAYCGFRYAFVPAGSPS